MNRKKNERFWDRIADKYSRQPIADEAAYERKLEMTREYLQPDMNVLEFGCGTGGTAIRHAPFVAHIDAIDVSENMLAIARAKAQAAGVENIDFIQADIEQLAVEDAKYDVILGLSILHLLPQWTTVIASVRRLLKPGGIFISSTTCIGDAIPFAGPVMWAGRAINVFPFVTVLKQEQLVREIEDAGFCIENHWQPAKNKAVFLTARKPIAAPVLRLTYDSLAA